MGRKPLFGSGRPAPRQIRTGAVNAIGPHERKGGAREQDGRNHRRAPDSDREARAGHRPDAEGEGHCRDGIDGEHHSHHSHHSRGNRSVEEARCREQRNDH